MSQILAEVVAIELIDLEAGTEEVIVVDESVFDTGRRERRWQLGLPDAFGNPSAAGARAEMLFDVVGEAEDLVVTVLGRNGDEDGFIKSAADDFNLAAGDEFAEAIEILGMDALDPFEQRARVVEAETDRGMPREKFDKRQVAILVGAFDYVFEISNRLMGVNQRNEFKFPHRRTTSGSK